MDGAAIVFAAPAPEEDGGENAAVAAAERFARDDPYVQNGLVTRYRVRDWTGVI